MSTRTPWQLFTPEQRNEALDQTLNKLNKLMEAWNDRITFASMRLPRRFESGQIHLILRFRSKKSGEIWLARIDKKPGTATEREHPIRRVKVLTPDREQCATFVDLVKIVDSPERLIPALVRIEPINRLDCLMAHSTYLSTLSGFVSFSAFKNRETGIVPRFATIGEDQLPRQMIQRASKIAKDITSNRARLKRDDRNPLRRAWESGGAPPNSRFRQ